MISTRQPKRHDAPRVHLLLAACLSSLWAGVNAINCYETCSTNSCNQYDHGISSSIGCCLFWLGSCRECCDECTENDHCPYGQSCVLPGGFCVHDVVLPCYDAGGDAAWSGDGWCDAVNNNPACQHDGGDCCEDTCVSAEYVCGYDDFDCLSWSTGPWESCSVSCGGGVQTRSVHCMGTKNSQIRDDSDCPGTKPDTTRVCNTQACLTYFWSTGSWGSCSVSCGGGVESRSVQCKSSSGADVSESYCEASKPAATRSCNTQACGTYAWVLTSWSTCSETCGGGVQSRYVQCQAPSGAIVEESYCSEAAPLTERPCNEMACLGGGSDGSSNVGIIAGAVSGGAILGVSAVVALFIWHGRRARARAVANVPSAGQAQVQPQNVAKQETGPMPAIPVAVAPSPSESATSKSQC
eukprot:scaffold543_cov312-Prasinococcus_capsulatus_cf.AAC.5